ncbi:MAG: hypothetical protein ACE5NP_00075 [Anaerolineae bacterium]
MSRIARFLVIAILVGVHFIFVSSSVAQCLSQYFPETGHNVRGEFFQFYFAHGGLDIFGYPLTEEFFQNGLKVQFFQRGVMEWHPQNPDPYKVQLALLGDLMGHREDPIPEGAIPHNDPHRRYFPQTGHTISGPFLTFFEQYGGIDIFGYPISEIRMEGGFSVQYFQRARMEWHPENPEPYRMQLGLLGSAYAQQIGLSPELLKAAPPEVLPPCTPTPGPTSPSDKTPIPITILTPSATPTFTPTPTVTPRPLQKLLVTASVKYRTTAGEGMQRVYVRVTDEEGQAVEGAQVWLVIHFFSGDRSLGPLSTDRNGTAIFDFPVSSYTRGYIVVIDVRVEYNGLTGTAQTAFLEWY